MKYVIIYRCRKQLIHPYTYTLSHNTHPLTNLILLSYPFHGYFLLFLSTTSLSAFVFEDVFRVSLKAINAMLQNKHVTILFETTIERAENSVPSGKSTPPILNLVLICTTPISFVLICYWPPYTQLCCYEATPLYPTLF